MPMRSRALGITSARESCRLPIQTCVMMSTQGLSCGRLWTHERAIAKEAHTGASLACPAGYMTPAATGRAMRLYTDAQNYQEGQACSSVHGILATLTKLNLTRLKTVRDRSARVSSARRFDDTKMKAALEIATSLPEPIAIPTSAAVSA